MNNFKIQIETTRADNKAVTLELTEIMSAANDKHEAVKAIEKYYKGISIKVGCGGSHIWISNINNERLVIIYL